MTSPTSTVTANVDLSLHYRRMLRCRLFETETARLWEEGRIPGEMHLGTGEEAIIAGIIPQLLPDDALSLDHRGTAAMLLRDVDPVALLREFMGDVRGLCSGQGGHMHLFSREHLAASSGIVGASAALATGFALAAKRLRPGRVAVAFFGDGAVNQGMLMEAWNLAVAWRLPVLFVCKDSEWAITTLSQEVTGGTIVDRARGFGLEAVEIDGTDVETVWETTAQFLPKLREEQKPALIHAHCLHLQGHFLGFQLLKLVRSPLEEGRKVVGSILKSFFKKGNKLHSRVESLQQIKKLLQKTMLEQKQIEQDPVLRCRKKLLAQGVDVERIESEIESEIATIVQKALSPE